MAGQGVVLVNFTHPLTREQLDQVERLLGDSVETLIERPADFAADVPFADQATRLVNAVGLSVADWQTRSIILNLPGHSVIAALVLAKVHGLAGGFPPVLRLRRLEPVNGYAIAELIDLQATRDAARQARSGRG